jgi:N-acetyl-anhydromuramyl-L-alanine amidase AmpD
MNEVEETLRVINNQIGFYEKQIKKLKEYRKEIMDKYGITMEEIK